MEIIRRLISWILILCLVIQNPIYIYADNEASGGSVGGSTYTPQPGGGGQGDIATFKSYGYKVTITNPGDKLSEVTPLGDTYTMEDLDQQFETMSQSQGKSYYRPGDRGIHAYVTDVGRSSRFSVGSNGAVDSAGNVIKFYIGTKGKCEWSDAGNPLAWALYDDVSVAGNVYSYNEELAYLFTAEGASACGDATSWLNEVNRLYDTIQPNPDYKGSSPGAPVSTRTPLNVFKGLFQFEDGQSIVDRFRHITWSTNVDALYSASGEDPYVRALSARLGLVAIDTLMCLIALRAGDQLTLKEMVNKTYAWITSDYSTDNMAMVMVESTSCINVDGNVNGSGDFVTLLDHMAAFYGCQEILMGYWPEDCHDNTVKALAWSTNGANTGKGGKGMLVQGINGYIENSTYVPGSTGGWSQKNRNYLRTLYPRSTDELFGYFVNWAYDAVCGSSSCSLSNKNSIGSFTWQLNPDGVNDKTPSEEINASSTIYNLNIAQDGYNDNNYTTDWVPTVRQDGVDGNKLRIRIYHISENLTEDQQATEYARDAVKKQGKPVTTEITKVIPGDGIISGIPKIGTLKAGIFDTGLLCTLCSRNPKNIRKSCIFLTKNGFFTHVLAGLKVRNP